jgi:tetratricopeptide (TPR) repeat protein
LKRWEDLGNELLQKQDLDAAIVCYNQAVKIAPRSASAHANLGMALSQKGRTQEAAAAWQQALEIAPDMADVQINLAWLLATASEASLRNGAKAVALAARANQLRGGGDPLALRALAAAYAEEGSYGLAAVTARNALELAVAQKNDALAAALQKEIKLYEAGAPAGNAPQ